ncbi:beta-ketoacyl synthase [Candidatus Scalindua japonica]|uniref:Beta-ketoacyl synthase n=1 Tax=Candidatus Scalindua japonica TaxID=1284222 RepID=A0A286TTF5_9BACT|nr:beta-ketoacyl synthase N-terminal-like domain-containing protein [Candidatus Scalindua japonica]GAX59135.1 beta-ketoacyl synthase [Candidatus Scalindua japonica]
MNEGTSGESGDETSLNNLDEKSDDRKFQSEQLIIKAENYLKKILASEIKLPENKIDSHEDFENYGINSTMVMTLNSILEGDFGLLSKTLFFEYGTIHELASYFVANHCEKLCKILTINERGLKTALNVPQDIDTGIDSLEKNRFIQKYVPELSSDVRQPFIFKEDDIAIIGVSGKYPMSKDLHEFWENLESGRNCITEIPEERWDYNAYFDSKKGKKGKSYNKWGGFIQDVDKFDPLFFRITPRDAKLMDPQQRLFLEVVWSTIEDAGYDSDRISHSMENSGFGDVGVFVGVMSADYQHFGIEENLKGNALATNTSYWDIANRVSYFFNFHGPSISIDTACSSSLTAIHMACESIKRGECRVAVAGGVNLSIHPRKYIGLSQFRFMSSDGRCRSFGEGGDGYVPGEGVGAIVLKPLSDAIADSDNIYAVIKGTSVNHGGKTNGYTVPNPNAHSMLINRTLEKANINPETLSYVEAHGTGTSLGDPIEITGLSKAFRRYTQNKQFCPIGSVKSNIGHLEAAAGIAALTKVLLQMKYKKLVPSIHSEMLNPNIHFDDSPFFVQRELCDWNKPVINENGKMNEYPRRAGVSSFGAGGANAHMIIEEYDGGFLPGKVSYSDDKSSEIIILSAKDEERLEEYVKVLKNYLIRVFKLNDEGDGHVLAEEYILKNIAYTLQIGRKAFEYRLAIIVKTREELLIKLNEFLNKKADIKDLFTGSVESAENSMTAKVQTAEEQELVKYLFNNKKASSIASSWVGGSEINWEGLYKDRDCKRVSLPTYPFARESYWMHADFAANPLTSLSGKDEVSSVLRR